MENNKQPITSHKKRITWRRKTEKLSAAQTLAMKSKLRQYSQSVTHTNRSTENFMWGNEWKYIEREKCSRENFNGWEMK